MKILVVDDEMLVRAGVRSSLDWEKYGYSIVGEAENGKAAMELIDIEKPDILLLDINMPVMNGIEVLKELKKRRNPCKVLVLSCHDEYEFVKEAMKAGAYDYLLKNRLNSENILNVINDIRDSILNEQEGKVQIAKLHEVAEESKSYKKKEILLNLIKGVYFKDLELENKIREYGIKIGKKNLCVAIFEVERFEDIKKRYDQDNIGLLQLSIKNISNDLVSMEGETEFIACSDKQYALLISQSNEFSEKNMYERRLKILNKFKNALSNFLNIDIVFGVSNFFSGYNNLKEAFNKAKIAMSQKFVYNKSQIIYFNEIESDDSFTGGVIGYYRKLIEESFEYNNFDKTRSYIKEFVDKIRCGKLIEIDVLRSFLAYLINLVQLSLPDGEVIFAKNTVIYYDIDEWMCIISSILDNAVNAQKHKSSSLSHLVRCATEYIDQNFEKELNLQVISNYLGVSESYISRLFNREMQDTITNYINNKRIEKAKEYLKKSNLKNYEIAEKVGFKSVVNFGIVFKRITGVNPSEYRNNQ